MPLLNQTRLDTVVIGFALGVAVVASVVFGTLPAWQASGIGDVVTRIREEGGSTTSDPKRQRMRSLLIVAETTLAVVLLVGAGLLARSFERLLSVDLGFSAEAVQTFNIALPDARYAQPLQRQAFVETLLARAATVPERGIRRRRVRTAAVEFPVSASRRRPATASRCRTMSRMR